jgi:hypothetical protein
MSDTARRTSGGTGRRALEHLVARAGGDPGVPSPRRTSRIDASPHGRPRAAGRPPTCRDTSVRPRRPAAPCWSPPAPPCRLPRGTASVARPRRPDKGVGRWARGGTDASGVRRPGRRDGEDGRGGAAVREGGSGHPAGREPRATPEPERRGGRVRASAAPGAPRDRGAGPWARRSPPGGVDRAAGRRGSPAAQRATPPPTARRVAPVGPETKSLASPPVLPARGRVGGDLAGRPLDPERGPPHMTTPPRSARAPARRATAHRRRRGRARCRPARPPRPAGRAPPPPGSAIAPRRSSRGSPGGGLRAESAAGGDRWRW